MHARVIVAVTARTARRGVATSVATGRAGATSSEVSDVATVVAFPGQGTQKVGMGKALAESDAVAGAWLARAERAVPGLLEVMFSGPAERLRATSWAQPAIVALSLALWHSARAASVRAHAAARPAAFMGHSVGEFTALVAAGALEFEDALRLVRTRGLAMEAALGGRAAAMVACFPISSALAAPVLAAAHARGDALTASVANVNSRAQCVISGLAADVAAAVAELRKQVPTMRRAVPLDVSAPFHSSVMAPVEPVLARAVRELSVAPRWQTPVVVNLTGTLVSAMTAAELGVMLGAHARAPVLWSDSLATCTRVLRVERFVHCGPGASVLSGFVRADCAPVPEIIELNDG